MSDRVEKEAAEDVQAARRAIDEMRSGMGIKSLDELKRELAQNVFEPLSQALPGDNIRASGSPDNTLKSGS